MTGTDRPEQGVTFAGLSGAQGFQRGDSAYRAANLALFCAGFSTFSLLYSVQPLLPVFSADFGVSPARSSLAMSLTTLLLAVSIMVHGAIGTRRRRKRMMAIGMSLTALLTLACAAAPGWPALLLLRALEGIALGGVPALAMAYIAEEYHPRSMGLAMGLYISSSAFGGMTGRVMTGLLTQVADWRTAMMAMGLGGLIAAALSAWFLPNPASAAGSEEPGIGSSGWRKGAQAARGYLWVLRHARLRLLVLAGFLIMGAFITLYNYAGYYLSGPPYALNQAELGALFTVYVLGMAASALAGHLADRLGRGVVLAGSGALALAGVLIGWMSPLICIIAGIALVTVAFFAGHTVASSWIGRLAGEAKTQAASLYLLAYYTGSSVLGSLGGWVWQDYGWTGIVLQCGSLFMLIIGIALWLWRDENADAAPR